MTGKKKASERKQGLRVKLWRMLLELRKRAPNFLLRAVVAPDYLVLDIPVLYLLL